MERKFPEREYILTFSPAQGDVSFPIVWKSSTERRSEPSRQKFRSTGIILLKQRRKNFPRQHPRQGVGPVWLDRVVHGRCQLRRHKDQKQPSRKRFGIGCY